MASPFRYDGPIPRDQMIDRDRDLEDLIDAAITGRLVCVYAPRRYGKTSLLDAAVDIASQAHGMVALRVDLLGVLSLTDLAVRLEQAYHAALHGRVRRAVQAFLAASNVGASVAGGGFRIAVTREPRTDPLPALHALLDLPVRIDERVYLVFDEFQSIMDISGAEAILRSHIQKHADHASYAFAGSEPGLMKKAFSDRSRPLYAQARPLRLDRLPPAEVLTYLHDRFDATGRDLGDMGEALLEIAQGHPQRTMLIADLLWQQTRRGATSGPEQFAAALEEALHWTRHESETRWANLTANQRRVLRGVLEYGSPVAMDALTALGLAKGSVVKTAQTLIDDGDLDKRDGGYQLVDPLFAEWIRRTASSVA